MADLKLGAAAPTDEERAAVDAVVAHIGPAVVYETERMVIGGKARADERRTLLLPALHALQSDVGWISQGGLDYACEVLHVPPAEAYGVATFYHLFAMDEPASSDVLHVCDDIACRNVGALELIDELRAAGHAVHESPCLGQCERGPAVLAQRAGNDDLAVVHADASDVQVALRTSASTASAERCQADGALRLLRRVGVVDPESLDDYRSHGGYEALDAAIAMGPEQIVAEVKASGLMGRGGAAFPTGVKWEGVAAQERGPHHLVCNADESEPGTFKDRVLMESDPFALVEAMTIAGIAIGAEFGWLYIRGEYPVATARLRNAIEQARAAGLLGVDVAGSGYTFDIDLRQGAGAYICGEETALFNSIEGYRGEPRNKPPFPTTHGLFSEPTAINNVETLVNVLGIVLEGGDAYAALGTERSSGSKLFCLSGKVARPGVYEVEFGATMREVLDLAGGVTGDVKAILLGGAAGSFVGPDMMDLPLTMEATRDAGVSLGSGVIMVFDDTDDMADTVRRIAEFFRDESCGQCVPCRVGTIRQEEVLVRLSNGRDRDDHLELLDDLATVMKDASICGLGHTASVAVRSAIDLGLLEGAS